MQLSFVAIPAFVTAAARMRMNHLRGIAGRNNVYYQAVDGLIVTQAGFDRLQAAGEVDNDRLGALKIVSTTNNGEILGCSDYRLGGKVVISGRSKKIEVDADGMCLQRKFYAANALFNGRALNTITESIEQWQRSRVVRKGTVSKDGWIEPFVLEV